MDLCRICGASLQSGDARVRGCCDVPHFESVEEQMGFWIAHDPEEHCACCETSACERRRGHHG